MMRKYSEIIIIILIATVIAPLTARALMPTYIRVRDAQTQNFLANVQVGLAQNAMSLFQGYTDFNGTVDISNIFLRTDVQTNAVYADYFISRPDYREVNGAKTFSAGEKTIFDLQPKVFCGDCVCTSSVETFQNCPRDCAKCGDGVCTSPPEDKWNCSADCQTHRVCSSGGRCIMVSGSGSDQCASDSSCVTIPTHKVCSGGKCITVPGVGVNQCSTDYNCSSSVSKIPSVQ